MNLRVWAKFGLAAFLLAVTTLPARAGLVTVNRVDGVNFSYTAVDTNGVLTVTFDPASMVTKINGSVISPTLAATFAQLTLNTKPTIDDIPGLSLHFFPPLNSTQYGISTLTPPSAPNVVFNYSIAGGQNFADGLTLTGAVQLAPGSATTFTQGTTTYDFSAFQNVAFFTLSLGTQDTTGTLMNSVLAAGNGTFAGTGQFDQFITTTMIPEPASVVLLGIGGVVAVAARRRRKA
jgi:hypothetical protein